MGYFGSITKAAVVAYQSSVGIVPDSGYVGPITRGQLNSGSSMAAAVNCPAGYTCTPPASTTTSTFVCPTGWTCTSPAGSAVASTAGIKTPGAQGIISVTQGPISTSVANAGQTKVPILDVRVQAQYSDVSVQSLQLDLGSSTSLYNFVYQTLYLVDPSTGAVLTTVPLNSSTVVQNGSSYVVGLAGFSFIVPKGAYKDLVVQADLYNQINTTYANSTGWTVGVGSLGLRAVDGAGVNLYGPSGSNQNNMNGDPIVQTMVIGQSLITSATANMSLDGSSQPVSSIGVTNTTQGQYLGLPVMTFDVNAQGDNLHLHQVAVSVANLGGGSVNAAYLYQGSTPIASASINGGVATFSNISDGTAGASIPVNSTTAFTVKVDVSGLINNASPAQIIASTTASQMVIYSSIDSNVNVTGSAIANQQTVFGQGPVISLSGAPTITTASGNNNSTTTKYTATFNVNVQAVGESVNFGLPATTTAAFGSTTTGANIAQIYKNSAALANNTGIQVIAGYSQPTNATVSPDGSFFTIAQNQSVTIPVTYSWIVTSGTADTYGIQMQGVKWFISADGSSATTTTFMQNQTAWRTPSL
jgi:hypothetical protein